MYLSQFPGAARTIYLNTLWDMQRLLADSLRFTRGEANWQVKENPELLLPTAVAGDVIVQFLNDTGSELQSLRSSDPVHLQGETFDEARRNLVRGLRDRVFRDFDDILAEACEERCAVVLAHADTLQIASISPEKAQICAEEQGGALARKILRDVFVRLETGVPFYTEIKPERIVQVVDQVAKSVEEVIAVDQPHVLRNPPKSAQGMYTDALRRVRDTSLKSLLQNVASGQSVHSVDQASVPCLLAGDMLIHLGLSKPADVAFQVTGGLSSESKLLGEIVTAMRVIEYHLNDGDLRDKVDDIYCGMWSKANRLSNDVPEISDQVHSEVCAKVLDPVFAAIIQSVVQRSGDFDGPEAVPTHPHSFWVTARECPAELPEFSTELEIDAHDLARSRHPDPELVAHVKKAQEDLAAQQRREQIEQNLENGEAGYCEVGAVFMSQEQIAAPAKTDVSVVVFTGILSDFMRLAEDATARLSTAPFVGGSAEALSLEELERQTAVNLLEDAMEAASTRWYQFPNYDLMPAGETPAASLRQTYLRTFEASLRENFEQNLDETLSMIKNTYLYVPSLEMVSIFDSGEAAFDRGVQLAEKTLSDVFVRLATGTASLDLASAPKGMGAETQKALSDVKAGCERVLRPSRKKKEGYGSDLNIYGELEDVALCVASEDVRAMLESAQKQSVACPLASQLVAPLGLAAHPVINSIEERADSESALTLREVAIALAIYKDSLLGGDVRAKVVTRFQNRIKNMSWGATPITTDGIYESVVMPVIQRFDALNEVIVQRIHKEDRIEDDVTPAQLRAVQPGGCMLQ